MEDVRTGVSITDLGLNDFRMDLLRYIRAQGDPAQIPRGLHAVVPARPETGLVPGVIFALRNLNEGVRIQRQNRLHPYYLLYVGEDGNVLAAHTEVKKVLDVVRAACKPGAPICLFIDWRQLPSMTDALQWAGWTWRGIAVWDKPSGRPQRGRFRQQAEFIVWGSNGKMPLERNVGCLPGVFRQANPANRIHVTEKPLQLMRDVVQICEPGGRILDPFAGSGTTILAAVQEGYEAVGIELTDAYFQLGTQRVKQALEPQSES